jgi:hypothetical protein
LVIVVALTVLLLLRAVAEGGPVRHNPLPFNVIIIIADDMALGDIGMFNDHRSRTPHLDRLVGSSVWFERGYSASPVCAPARAALRTEYEKMNKVIKASTELSTRVQFADIWPPMLNADGALKKDLFIEDGLHMNKKGYDLWIQVIAPFVLKSK